MSLYPNHTVDAELCRYRRDSVSPGGFGYDPCLVLNPLAEEQLWRDMGIFILRILWHTEDQPYISTVGILLAHCVIYRYVWMEGRRRV